MRFSLRTLLIVFVIIGLALATFLSTWKLQQAEREIERVRRIYGAGGVDRFEMMSLEREDVKDSRYFHLIHFDAPKVIRLQISHYDGATHMQFQDFVYLAERDVEFALSYSSSSNPIARVFTIQPRRDFSTSITIPSEPSDGEKVYCYPKEIGGTIDYRPFLIFVFSPAELDDEPNFQWIGLDEEKLKAWCNKYKTECVFFKFSR